MTIYTMIYTYYRFIVIASSELRKVLFFGAVCDFFVVYEIPRELLNGGRRVWSFARTSLKIKVSRSISAACARFMFGKKHICSSFFCVWTCIALFIIVCFQFPISSTSVVFHKPISLLDLGASSVSYAIWFFGSLSSVYNFISRYILLSRWINDDDMNYWQKYNFSCRNDCFLLCCF